MSKKVYIVPASVPHSQSTAACSRVLNTTHRLRYLGIDMEVTGFGLAVVAEARTLVNSIVVRIANYRRGPNAFRILADNVTNLAQNVEEVDRLLRKFPHALPDNITDLFNRTFTRVRANLKDLDDATKKEFSKLFAGSNIGLFGKLKSKARRTVRATDISEKMSMMETQISESSNQLLQLTTMLANALSIQMIVPKLENLSVGHSARAVYRAAITAPGVPHTVNLNFEANADGGFETPEGILKHQVLSSTSSATVTAATGALNAAYGVVGMAGVGKTTAIQGLATDEDIQTRFPDGVHYMALGQGATSESVVQEILKIMRMTGASARFTSDDASRSIREVVDHAVAWFKGKTCLFLVDDLWPTETCATGFLNELRQLLRGSPSSRMAITTRSVSVALEAGCIVNFGARDPLGPVSLSIFMAYAVGSNIAEDSPEPGHNLSQSTSKILTFCGGLPIALSVAGCAVALLVRTVGSFERACRIYAVEFEDSNAGVGDARTRVSSSLSTGILLSLNFLEAEFLKWKAKNAPDFEHEISDLYLSLSVLTSQLWVPVSVLGRMWQLEENFALDVAKLFCEMSLATLSYRELEPGSPERPGITLHDLHLDFCRRRTKEQKSSSTWHEKLLNGYMEDVSILDDTIGLCSSDDITGFRPRAWWCPSIVDDGYIHANITRHLSCSGRVLELAALLIDVRWTHLRFNKGGITALKKDFEYLEESLMFLNFIGGKDCLPLEITEGFKLVFKAVQLSWGRISEGLRGFQFQTCGRLLCSSKSNIIVNVYMKNVLRYTPRPYLMPVSTFFPDLNSAQIIEIPVGAQCCAVACSSCGRYIAAGTSRDIVVADAVTGNTLTTLQGHTDIVRSMRFVEGSAEIVSGSHDCLVIIWEWKKSVYPSLILNGHSDWVTSVSVSSDGMRIYSCSHDRTVKAWERTTGLQTGEFVQCRPIECLAVSADEEKVALGLDDGTMIVVDSSLERILFAGTEEHEGSVICIAFSPDRLYLATGSRFLIRLWNAETWTKIGTPLEGHNNWVRSVAFSPDGHRIASGSKDGIVRLWTIPFGLASHLSSECCIPDKAVEYSSSDVGSVVFSSDGKRIIAGSLDGNVRIWNAEVEMKKKVCSFAHKKGIYGVAISEDGLRIASASLDRTVRLWDSQSGLQIGTPLEGHTDEVNCVSFSPDSLFLVSGSEDRTLRLWDTKACTQQGHPFNTLDDSALSVSFSSDGLRVVSGSQYGSVRVWNAQTREQLGRTHRGHAQSVLSVSESSDGSFVVSRDNVSETIIWNRLSGEIAWRSKKCRRDFSNTIADEEAEMIIRSCGQEKPHLWPAEFPEYNVEVYCEDEEIFSSLLGEKKLLGSFPFLVGDWMYNDKRKVFAAGLESGALAICKFVGS